MLDVMMHDKEKGVLLHKNNAHHVHDLHHVDIHHKYSHPLKGIQTHCRLPVRPCSAARASRWSMSAVEVGLVLARMSMSGSVMSQLSARMPTGSPMSSVLQRRTRAALRRPVDLGEGGSYV